MLNYLRDNKLAEKLDKNNIVTLKTAWSDVGGVNSTDNAAYLADLAEAFYDKMVWLINENLTQTETDPDEEQKTEIVQVQLNIDSSSYTCSYGNVNRFSFRTFTNSFLIRFIWFKFYINKIMERSLYIYLPL